MWPSSAARSCRTVASRPSCDSSSKACRAVASRKAAWISAAGSSRSSRIEATSACGGAMSCSVASSGSLRRAPGKRTTLPAPGTVSRLIRDPPQRAGIGRAADSARNHSICGARSTPWLRHTRPRHARSSRARASRNHGARNRASGHGSVREFCAQPRCKRSRAKTRTAPPVSPAG